MKNRIWNQAKRLAVSAVLFTTAVCGNWGQTEEIKASGVDTEELYISQSAQWTDESANRAKVLIEVRGLLAYRDKYVPKAPEEETEIPGETEDLPEGDTIEGVTEEPVEAAESSEQSPEGEWMEESMEIWEEPEAEYSAGYTNEDIFEPEYESFVPQLAVECYISEYFQLITETLPSDCRVEECKAINQKGEEIALSKVVYPVDVSAVTEDILRFSIEIALREEYCFPLQIMEYPVMQDEPLNKDCPGTGVHLLEVQETDASVLVQAQSPFLEIREGKADFELELKSASSQVKAGNSHVYELHITNTGDFPLKNMQIQSGFSIEETDSEEVKAVWESAPNVEVQGKQAAIQNLGCGERIRMFMTVQLMEGDGGKLTHKVTVQSPCPKNPEEIIGKEILTETEILPLKADFSVEKTADRTVAYPGDTVNYQICIRNTGERTLHSVLSTERFLGANIQAQFLPQEGVTLNSTRTQALIREIAPGQVFALQAAVTLPRYFDGQELVNQVTVVTEETGTKEYESQSSIEVTGRTPAPTITPYSPYQVDYSSGNTGKSTYLAGSAPKTGDNTKSGMFLMLLSLAVLTGTGVFWKLKGKSKD